MTQSSFFDRICEVLKKSPNFSEKKETFRFNHDDMWSLMSFCSSFNLSKSDYVFDSKKRKKFRLHLSIQQTFQRKMKLLYVQLLEDREFHF